MNDIKRKFERRRTRRSSVLLTAAINREGASRSVRLINLSPGGSTIESRDLGRTGDWIEFRRNGLVLRSQIIWSEEGRSGVRFERPVELDQLFRRMPEQASFAGWVNRLGLDPSATGTVPRRMPRRPGRGRR
jgi:hypothetical protein